jgi:hypothetical protein
MNNPRLDTDTGQVAEQYVVNVDTSVQSRDSQEQEGILERRQRGIRQMLAEAGPMGKTALEIEKATGEGHGKVSGALSAMHREGMVAALKLDRRNGYGVYVLPGQVGNRLTREYQPNGTKDQTRPEPIPAPARPRLTPAEVELFAKVRTLLQSDQPIVRLKQPTLKALLAAIDRLSA